MPKTRSSDTDSDEMEQLRSMLDELKEELSNRHESNSERELEELRAELAELRSQFGGARPPQGGDAFKLPDPFKYLSEFTGNKKRTIRMDRGNQRIVRWFQSY